MKRLWRVLWLALFGAGLSTGVLAADTAMVARDRINVRGQPSLTGEVVAQLRKGAMVTILEEISANNAQAGEPKKWARIALPTNSHAWVNASFIDSTNKTVLPRRLNVRAGPSENYSVIARLDRGTPVTEIRSQNGWSEIEPPVNAYAFVAMDYLSPATNQLATEAPVTPAVQPPVVQEPVPPESTPDKAVVKAAEKPLAEEPSAKPPTNAVAPAVSPPAVAPADLTIPDSIPIPAVTGRTNESPAAASTTAAEPPPKRIVRREGLVRRTTSIQAPTYFELESTETGKTMNYLRSSASDIHLREYRGYKIIVTGEEYLDVRWRTPVIEVETLQVVP